MSCWTNINGEHTLNVFMELLHLIKVKLTAMFVTPIDPFAYSGMKSCRHTYGTIRRMKENHKLPLCFDIVMQLRRAPVTCHDMKVIITSTEKLLECKECNLQSNTPTLLRIHPSIHSHPSTSIIHRSSRVLRQSLRMTLQP